MSNQGNFLISTLFIVVIVLCVVLTRFYFDVTKNTENRVRDNKIDSVVRTFGTMQVFRSVNGGYGLMDEAHSVVIEPEWMEILDVTPEMAIVSGEMHNEILVGGIDYEENMILPFVFASIEKLGDGYHIGTIQKDGRYVIYDKNYLPVFQKSFEKVSYYNKLLTVGTGQNHYLYDMSGETPVLRRADLQCRLLGSPLNWRISNQVYLAELCAEDLEIINQYVADYMQMLQENDFFGLEKISGTEYSGNLIKQDLFEGIRPGKISQFWFFQRQSGAYDFAFRMEYRSTRKISDPETGTELSQIVPGQAEVHCYFRKNTENRLILTASDLQFRDTDPAAEE